MHVPKHATYLSTLEWLRLDTVLVSEELKAPFAPHSITAGEIFQTVSQYNKCLSLRREIRWWVTRRANIYLPSRPFL